MPVYMRRSQAGTCGNYVNGRFAAADPFAAACSKSLEIVIVPGGNAVQKDGRSENASRSDNLRSGRRARSINQQLKFSGAKRTDVFSAKRSRNGACGDPAEKWKWVRVNLDSGYPD